MAESPYITASVAARRYFFKSLRFVERQCLSGAIKSARKASTSRFAHWQMLRSEVVAICARSHFREDLGGDLTNNKR